MQGIYVRDEDNQAWRRPKSKKEIRLLAATDPALVRVEATSLFGDEPNGPVPNLGEGQVVYFVGPDPYTSRRFYGSLVRQGGKVVVK